MRCFLWLILTTLTTAAAIAQKTKGGTVDNTVTKTTPRIFSLVVGISNYAQLPKLDFADRDAKAFRDYLVTVQGVPANRVFCLTNDSATNLNIFDRLYQLSDSLKAGDQFLFYFSGHGDWESKISDNSLLLLRNAPMQNYLRYPDQFINSQTLNAFLRKLSEQNVTTVLIADACRSGNLIGGKEGSQTTVLQLKQGFKNSIRILSCMPDELSFESAKWGGGRGRSTAASSGQKLEQRPSKPAALPCGHL
ncbi:MAG: caspase family protein [Chitinophagaceae bacterium]|nr:MAG: caspase family protein [Chitinophagaceae bacterium]